MEPNSLKFLTEEEAAFRENLSNWRWRLENLYYIKNKAGQKVKFQPNWAQIELLDNFWHFSIILKARQLGITTLFCILYLDQILFSANKTAGIIAHTDKDVRAFFKDKVKFAWDNLPEWLKENLGPPSNDSAQELSFPNGSRIFVSQSVRGSTLQYLHLSEFAKVCARFPARAEEIVTGSINAVEQGNFVTIESTAEGNEGYFYRFCREAEQAKKLNKTLSPLDFRYFFFPWWKHPEYRLKGQILIDKDLQDYFETLKNKEGIILDQEQMAWYASKKKVNQDQQQREYPSTPDEAFAASIEGAYYSRQMARVYEEKRVRLIPHDSRIPVMTFWDLGMNDYNVILFAQAVGNEIRFIDCYFNHGEGLAHYVNILKSKPYTYGRHIFPHDVDVRNLDREGKSRRQTLTDLGLTNIHAIERTQNINDDIEGVRKLFSRFYFDEEKCKPLIDACNSYRKQWDDKLGQFKNNPLHNDASHFADVLRLLVKGWTQHEIGIDGKTNKSNYEDFF